MELRQLEYFVSVAQELNYNRAARKLNVSQPAITKQIKHLEEELNVCLFDEIQKSKHKKVVLTETGIYFYHEAKKILQSCKTVLEGVKKIENKQKIIKVGIYQLLPKSIVINTLHFLKERLRDIDIKIIEYHSYADVEEALQKDVITLGIGLILNKQELLDYITIEEGVFQVCLYPSHNLVKREVVRVQELKNEQWIDYLSGTATISDRVEKIFLAQGIIRENKIVQVVSSFELMFGLVSAGYGIGIVPSFYDSLHYDVIKKNIIIDENSNKTLDCKQVIAFKKNNNSFIINRLKA